MPHVWGGLYIEPKDLKKALSVFKCDGDVGQLSEIVKGQLLKKL